MPDVCEDDTLIQSEVQCILAQNLDSFYVMDALDINKDGKVDKLEINGEPKFMYIVANQIKKFDGDGDGMLDLQEYGYHERYELNHYFSVCTAYE